MNRLDGKVALISWAARGIGGETARLMVEAGVSISAEARPGISAQLRPTTMVE
jgi:NADP-dependent 3-hydroxy acid dehydrogenase YdfG